MLQRGEGGSCPLSYKGQPVSWKEIAEWLSEEEDCYVCDQTVRNNFNRLLGRLQDQLTEDPYIREWLLSRGLLPEGK